MRTRCGFSLIELVIVVVLIAIVGAIAIPRLASGAAGAGNSALVANLRLLRGAIDQYAAEHGGSFPGAGMIANQLTQFTDDQGNVSSTMTGAYIFGPYLRAIPALPLGTYKGATGIAALPAAGVGWLYDPATGVINANVSGATIEQLDEDPPVLGE
ncbi:MAG: type II secretion system protein [Tepidisphaeraceae bacterium]